jgi:hypothetical protein
MRYEMWVLCAAFILGLAAAGCVARVDPAPGRINVDADPPRPGAEVDVQVDPKPGGVDVKVD